MLCLGSSLTSPPIYLFASSPSEGTVTDNLLSLRCSMLFAQVDHMLRPRSAWVCVVDGACPYYWNFATHASVNALPPGEVLSWSTFYTPESRRRFYFSCSTGASRQSYWELPPSDVADAVSSSAAATRDIEDHSSDVADAVSSSAADTRDTEEFFEALDSRRAWLHEGASVYLYDLKQTRFNGQVGNVIGAADRRVHVQLPDLLGGQVLAVRLQHLQPLPSGTLLVLKGSSHVTGMAATVQAFSSEDACYDITLQTGGSFRVRAGDVLAQCRLWDIPLGTKYTFLSKTNEKRCLFIDNKGEHRHYNFMLPLSLGACPILDAPPWPLLIYLHGTGGRTLFTHKTIHIGMPGLQFVARNFVVVCPVCEWTWKESPADWVLELVAALGAAKYIDDQRIYLTGFSMGAIGVWELAARDPEVFAAIVPVAGHHKEELVDWIAMRLFDIPIWAIHSDCDRTSPLQHESALWSHFDGCPNFNKSILAGFDHMQLFEEAFCQSLFLYEWLLQRVPLDT